MKKTIYILSFLLVNSLTMFSQSKETKVADTFFDNLSYITAAKEYHKLSLKNPTKHVLKRLGDSYYENVDMVHAAAAYKKLDSIFKISESEYMFKYAQSLRANGNFKESKIWMEKFHIAENNDTRGDNFTNKKAVLADIKDKKGNYVVSNLKGINTPYSDFGATEYGNTILFSSPQKKSPFVKRSHTRNQKNFLDIYKVLKENIDSSQVRPMFSDRVNTKYHESSVTFSQDETIMYFTRNNYNEGSYKTDEKGYNKLKIFRSEWVKDKWDNITEVPFNSNEYSTGHPTLTKDGKRLYFVSNMPGGFGQTDIYYVDVNDDGTYGKVQNLGNKVNTEGREMFPFISDDNILYFSSDGHFGIGALDIFESKFTNGEFEKPVNLKAPINSELDDFAFSINTETQKGYLSSNRKGGVGDDDIYSFVQLDKKEVKVNEDCKQVITGFVKESQFKKPLSYANLVVKDTKGVIVSNAIAGDKGQFSFKLPCNENYTITASKEYYKPDTKSFSTTSQALVELELDFNLKIVDDFVYDEKGDLVIKINDIYFDYNKWNIRPDAQRELNYIVKIMNKYPKIIVQSGSHTDARGRESFNLNLSDKRAKSTVDYIVSKGISRNRISGKGFGESQLTNNCVDNDSHSIRVKCTEDEHQANRRTAFVLLNVGSYK
ncbi:OmpA family protein [uncultured Polaribacter sp.]|uniref:OmpA family protein n=1 Tax=uncultured Polaribacter sp. TaxID=174711 RepID=UPI00262F196E|nr:OmpA family protein [uncultured Polaribacter sp.]